MTIEGLLFILLIVFSIPIVFMSFYTPVYYLKYLSKEFL